MVPWMLVGLSPYEEIVIVPFRFAPVCCHDSEKVPLKAPL